MSPRGPLQSHRAALALTLRLLLALLVCTARPAGGSGASSGGGARNEHQFLGKRRRLDLGQPLLRPVRNCYLAPLRTGQGCLRLGEALAGPEFGLNSFGQESSGKAACLDRLRDAGGNTFVFSPGRCELWSCASPAALHGSATGARPEPEEEERAPVEAGCFSIADREECCRRVDGRMGVYGGFACVPALPGAALESGSRCEPSCWVDGTCEGDTGGPRGAGAGTCPQSSRRRLEADFVPAEPAGRRSGGAAAATATGARSGPPASSAAWTSSARVAQRSITRASKFSSSSAPATRSTSTGTESMEALLATNTTTVPVSSIALGITLRSDANGTSTSTATTTVTARERSNTTTMSTTSTTSTTTTSTSTYARTLPNGSSAVASTTATFLVSTTLSGTVGEEANTTTIAAASGDDMDNGTSYFTTASPNARPSGSYEGGAASSTTATGRHGGAAATAHKTSSTSGMTTTTNTSTSTTPTTVTSSTSPATATTATATATTTTATSTSTSSSTTTSSSSSSSASWAAPQRTTVYSELCDYQEPLGGELGQERRSPVFVKLWEWNYDDVARECREFLGPNGVDAVQVSPVVEHIPGPSWWTKYQPVSFGLTSRSGTPDELRRMVAECRQSGVEVIVDVVLNHIAMPCQAARYPEEGMPCTGWNGTRFGNRKSAGARGWDAAGPDHFHHNQGTPYFNCGSGPPDFSCARFGLPDCSYCDMYGMPDWNTGLQAVRDMHLRHLRELHEMGVSMLRVDAAIYESVPDLSAVVNRLPWDYVYQEWWGEYPPDDRSLYIGHYRDVEYRWKVANSLAILDAARLPELLDLKSGVVGVEPERALYPITFVDGRTDQADQRSATYKNGLEYHQQQKFFLAWPGGVSVLLWGGFGWGSIGQGPPGCEEGQQTCRAAPVFGEDDEPKCLPTPRQSPLPWDAANRRGWVCEHRWEGVAGLIGFRKACRGLPLTQTWSSAQPDPTFNVGVGRLAWRIGEGCFAALVRGHNEHLPRWFGRLGSWPLAGTYIGLPQGRYCDVASLTTLKGWDRQSCPREVVLDEHGFAISGEVPDGDLLAIHLGARLPDDV